MSGSTSRAASRTFKLLVLVAVAAFVLPLAGSQAATPNAGTISESSPSISWSGDNHTPTAASCDGPNDPACDNFKLTIAPPSFQYQVVIQLAPIGDYDLYVYAPDGGQIAGSGNAPGQTEIVVLTNPAAGTYTVSGAPFAAGAGVPGVLPSYTASATIRRLGGDPATPASGTEHLTYSSYKPPATLGNDAGEPSIGVSWRSGDAMYQAGLETLRATFDDSVSPANASWKDVSFLQTSVVSLDPIGFIDHQTNRWFSSQLSGTTSLAASTDDAGNNWLPSEGGPGNGGVDHQTFGGGPYHAPLSGTPAYANAVYYCSQDLVAALCARSDTGGTTFGPAVPIYTNECGGLHGHVKVAPDGTVYVPNRGCGEHQAVIVSENNGVTWQVRPIPNSTPGDWDPSVSLATDGTVYFAYDDGDGHEKVAVSHDRGKTWGSSTDIGAPFGVAHAAFPRVAAGDPDRAAVAFLGTSYTGGGAFDDNPEWPGVWYLYISETFDGGKTWSTVNATPNDPVQRGTICIHGLDCVNGTRNLLDFNGSDVDKQGRFYVAYTDGCVEACIVAGPGSFTSKATIARQVSGKRLFAAFDTTGVPAAPSLYAKSTAETPPSTILSWQEPDTHGSAITSYKLYRNGALLATVGGDQRGYTDSTATSGASYQLSAVNGSGEGPKSPPVTPVAVVTPPPADPCTAPVTVLTDPTGDSTGGDPAKDVQSLSFSETRAIGLGKIAFVLKVASLSSVPANTTWPVLFSTKDGKDHWVKMETDALGKVTFAYGDESGYDDPTATSTPADTASNYTGDGTITIIVPRSAFGLNAGDGLSRFLTRISIRAGVGSLTPDNMPDSLARTGAYTVKGNENCTVPQPDLAIAPADIGTYTYKGQGGPQVVVAAVVHNNGTADASAVQVQFAVDGQVFATQTVPNIAKGTVARLTAGWSSKGQKGNHTFTVTADPANTVSESNEGNNSASKLVTVK
jgi:hypothetical protein